MRQTFLLTVVAYVLSRSKILDLAGCLRPSSLCLSFVMPTHARHRHLLHFIPTPSMPWVTNGAIRPTARCFILHGFVGSITYHFYIHLNSTLP
uniref:Uncharacterized protein n=1 Tax=Arundo donax TaxID=35708 RepID=A0A0A9HAD5_ARUDO